MKVHELLEATGRTINFRDPDHEPGAVEREGAARQGLEERQKLAVENINALVAKYKLGGKWKVGTNSSYSGTFIMSDNSGGSPRGKFKTAGGVAESTLWVSGRYEDLVLTLAGVDLTREERATALAKMKELIPGGYGFSVQSDDRPQFKSVSFHFGEPSRYSDKKNFAGMKKMFEYLKKEAPLK